MRDTYQFVGNAFSDIVETRSDIIQQQVDAEDLNNQIEDESRKQDKQNEIVKNLSNKYLIDDEF